MSSSFPSLTVTGGGLNVSADVSELTMSLRELVNGQGITEITLNNAGGKYVAAQWPPFTATSLLESGLYKVWSWTINGIGPWYGRVVGLDVDASIKAELIKVSVAMMDEPLHNHYLTNLIPQDTIGNMILKGCQQWTLKTPPWPANNFTAGGITYSVDTSTNGTGPLYPSPLGYNCARTRIFMADFIKDLLITASDASNFGYGYGAYVDSTQGPNTTTLYIFQQAAKTYASSLTWGTNVSSFKHTRNILRSKNFIEYVAALSNQEPPINDPWTEDDLSMWQKSNPIPTGTTTHYCPSLNMETTTDCYNTTIAGILPGTYLAILIDTYAILGTGNTVTLDLSLQKALGENFNALQRNATSLNFYYKITGAIVPLTGHVYLVDANGFKIQSVNDLTNTAGGISVPTQKNWLTWSAPVGAATQFISKIPFGTGQTFLEYWFPVGNPHQSATNFDWSNVTDIIFTISNAPLPGNINLSIDHLYFAQSYQPTKFGVDQDAIFQYGQRMQYYDASMYPDDKSLAAFAAARTTTLSPGLMDLDITTSLGPETEGSKGFQPGFCFAAGNVNIPNYNFDKVAWRAVEVETHIVVPQALGGAGEAGLTTRFHLTPASGPLIGPNAAKFDPRRFW